MKRRLAIFDIDGTIFRSSLIIESFNELVRVGIFPRLALARVERSWQAWLDRKGHYNDYMLTVVQEFYHHLKGQRPERVEPIIRRVIDRQKDRIYRYTRALIKNLRRRGYLLIAISNSPSIMVEHFARRHKFLGVIGRKLELKQGRYVGRTTFPLLDKVAILEDLLATKGIRADRPNSIAVGDSEGDLGLLAYVGHPIAFNPSHILARIAQKRGWKIVVERKDVIYTIKKAGLTGGTERQRLKI